tara:strand:+ start:211 stop:360 length:150 start_codon:yes stop_codon:yes gene_type:complete
VHVPPPTKVFKAEAPVVQALSVYEVVIQLVAVHVVFFLEVVALVYKQVL